MDVRAKHYHITPVLRRLGVEALDVCVYCVEGKQRSIAVEVAAVNVLSVHVQRGETLLLRHSRSFQTPGLRAAASK